MAGGTRPATARASLSAASSAVAQRPVAWLARNGHSLRTAIPPLPAYLCTFRKPVAERVLRCRTSPSDVAVASASSGVSAAARTASFPNLPDRRRLCSPSRRRVLAISSAASSAVVNEPRHVLMPSSLMVARYGKSRAGPRATPTYTVVPCVEGLHFESPQTRRGPSVWLSSWMPSRAASSRASCAVMLWGRLSSVPLR